MYFKKKNEKVGKNMDNLTQKICMYLQANPKSNARDVCKEIGADKTDVNSCLYANEGTFFQKEGLTPPLWRNIVDSSSTETGDTELTEVDGSEPVDDFEIDDSPESINCDEDWTRLDAEDQKDYLAINARIGLGEKISKNDRSRMNQLKNRIHQSVRNEITFIESAERKIQKRAEYATKVNEEVNKAWSVEEQRVKAIEALSLQFESNLRRLAYGHLILSKKDHVEQEHESQIEIRQAQATKLIKSISSTIETRLSNLESLTDEELVSSTVRFGWINRNRSSDSDARSAIEMFPTFEEIEEVKIYRSRFQTIFHRIKEA
jgi:hypothetical protein